MRKKRLTKTELDIVHLRYFDGLLCKEIADKMGLSNHQVKYRLRKPNVKEYIRKVVVPKIVKPVLEQIDIRLANPIESYAEQLKADLDAETYQWFAGRKMYQTNNRKRMQAVKKIGRIYGITHDQKNKERDLRKAIVKHVLWLKEMRCKFEYTLETGEIRFY